MPLIETKGAASAQGFGEFTVVGPPPVYIEDVFSTYLYTGNGGTQTITNGIDLLGKGGMVWGKSRSNPTGHSLSNTVSGITNYLDSSATFEQQTGGGITSVSSSGFDLTASGGGVRLNQSGYTYVSWTFRKQPKFFDVVTFVKNASTNQRISHSLGSVPGCIIVKRVTSADDWYVYHRSLGGLNKWISLNSTGAVFTTSGAWGSSDPTSTDFGVSTNLLYDGGGTPLTYVAYLFAHDAGGFGLSGSDNVISCGSFTTDGSGNATVSLGYEPQWVLLKTSSNSSYDWWVLDNMRGFRDGISTAQNFLYPNLSSAEVTNVTGVGVTSTGFNVSFLGSTPFIYIAIRRGPMKTPTSGTSVFSPILNGAGSAFNVGFVPDMNLTLARNGTSQNMNGSRLVGNDNRLETNNTNAEQNYTDTFIWNGASNTFTQNIIGGTPINWMYGRAPGFFDEVCYTGTGSNTTINHNLGVTPELIIGKTRSASSDWPVFTDFSVSAYKRLYLSLTNAAQNADYTSGFGISSRSATTLGLQTISGINQSGQTQVLYLFASCPGVSKVTNFTGTGTLQTINCGFAAGSRFVLIKRTDSTGDWYVWDSSRGLSSSTDPYLLLNSTAAEVTGTNWVDTTSTGFQVTAASGNNVNINGASYIALAIA